jgi:hypothetical protein
MGHTLIYIKKHIYSKLGHQEWQDHGTYLPLFIQGSTFNVNIEENVRDGN